MSDFAHVFRAPLKRAQCMVWTPESDGLWIGADQSFAICDRAFGPQIYAIPGTPVAMGLRSDGQVALAVDQGGSLMVVRRAAAVARPSVNTHLSHRFGVFSIGKRFYVAGRGPRGERLLRVHRRGVKRIARLPDGSACGPGPDGPQVARIIDRRLVVTAPEATGLRKTDDGYRLAFCGEHIVGWTVDRVYAWPEGREAMAMPIPRATACDLSPDGRLLAIGTLDGELALVDLDDEVSRSRPQLRTASRFPIRAIRFSPDGGHLAALGQYVDVWDCGGGTW